MRMKMLLSDILSSVKACHIVIDRIDECSIDEQKDIISTLLAIQKNTANSCRVLFSYRNHKGYIKDFLDQESVTSLQVQIDDAEPEYRMLETKKRVLSEERLDPVSLINDVEDTLSNQDSEDADSTGTYSLSSEAGSSSSKTSASSYTNDELVATTLDEVTRVFMDDEELCALFAEAFTKHDQDKVVRHGVRLLKWLGRRLSEVAKTPAEKVVARFFIRGRHDSALMCSVETRLSKNDAQEQSSEQPVQSSIKQERLEKYLQDLTVARLPIPQPRDEGWGSGSRLMQRSLIDTKLTGMTDWGGNESESSSDSENEEKELEELTELKEIKEIKQQNISMLKVFVQSSDAFMRFKEELNDFNNPFKNEAMWRKKLWFGRQQLYFELPNTVSRLTRMDDLKLLLGRKLGQPIQWWPLKQPRRRLSSNEVRMIFLCVSKVSWLPFEKDTNRSARTAAPKRS